MVELSGEKWTFRRRDRKMAMEYGEAGWLSGFADELRGRFEFSVMNEERNEGIGKVAEKTRRMGADEIFFGFLCRMAKRCKQGGPCVAFSDPCESTWVVRPYTIVFLLSFNSALTFFFSSYVLFTLCLLSFILKKKHNNNNERKKYVSCSNNLFVNFRLDFGGSQVRFFVYLLC